MGPDMVRILFRLIILGVGAFFLYFSIAHSLDWLASVSVFLLLFLFFLGTYVTTLEQNHDRTPGDGIPTNLAELQDTLSSRGTLFRMDRRGRRLFYPWGNLGDCYVMRDSSEQRITGFLVTYSVVNTVIFWMVLVFIKDQAQSIISFLVIAPISMVWFRTEMQKLLRALEVVRRGSDEYSPLPTNKRYTQLGIAILVVSLIGGLGGIYNNGLSLGDFLLAFVAAALLIMGGYKKLVAGSSDA